MRISQTKKNERGIVLLLSSLMLLFIVVPTVGLAIDVGVIYTIKAKLQTAVDGAALAAARSLSRGLTPDSQQDSARTTAQRFYSANIPNGWMGLDSVTVPPTIAFPTAPPKTTIIRVTANVDVPTYFMRILGVNTMRVASTGTATRRDVNIIMVLDRSGSLETSGSCIPMKNAATSFVQTFVDGRDRIGLITYGTSYYTDFGMAYDFQSRSPNNLLSYVNNISCNGHTNSAAAYFEGWKKLQAVNEPGTLNVILFFTDGQPNTVTLNDLRRKNACGPVGAVYTGVITPASTGSGIYRHISTGPAPITNDYNLIQSGVAPNPSTAGCTFVGDPTTVENDIISLAPTTNENDINGNGLTGYKTPINRSNGRIKFDTTTITNAGINALANAATRVRTLSAAANLDVMTYCIGLGGPGAAEDVLLQRVANVPASPVYDSTKATGMYIKADDASQLQLAFASLASDILRISQ